MRFRRRNGGLVLITDTALGPLSRFVQRESSAAEAGGVLLGRLIREADDVIVDEATAPTTDDRRSRYGFWRARPKAQDRVTRAWHESGATRNYLGEWHTHPEDDPVPSDTDTRNWQRIAISARFEQDFLIF